MPNLLGCSWFLGREAALYLGFSLSCHEQNPELALFAWHVHGLTVYAVYLEVTED